MRYDDALCRLWKGKTQAVTDGRKILTTGPLGVSLIKDGVRILPATDQTKEERDADWQAKWLDCELPQDLADFDLAAYLGNKGAMKVIIAECGALEE